MWSILQAITALLLATIVKSDEKCFSRNLVCNPSAGGLSCQVDETEPISLCTFSACKFKSIGDYCKKKPINCSQELDNKGISVYCKDDSENDREGPPYTDPPQSSSGGNNTTVIVVAVCVSVVVVVIAVLITAVYCWRVRRKTKRQKQAADVELRSNAATNNGYRSETTTGTPRPDSTYNTITDLEREPSYHTLKDQNSVKHGGYNKLRYVNNIQVVTKTHDRKVRAVPQNVEEDYNRINLRKGHVAKSDPSYDHLPGGNTESDYNSNGDTDSKSSSAYNYGVPIKIRDMGRYVVQDSAIDKNNATDPDSSKETRINTMTNGDDDDDDDDYVIPKEELTDQRQSIGDKPRAIVNPLKPNENRDDYEVAAVKTDTSGAIDDHGLPEIQLPTKMVPKTLDDKDKGDYERAAVKTDPSSEFIEQNVPKVELPTRVIPNTSVDKELKVEKKDDYEIAVVKAYDSHDNVEQIMQHEKLQTGEIQNDISTKVLEEGHMKKHSDEYEVAAVKAVHAGDSVEKQMPIVELPTRVTIGDNSAKSQDDGYETAVVNNVERL